MEDMSTTIFGRDKENKGEGKSHAKNVMQAQPSHEANNLEFLETTSVDFFGKKREATHFKLEKMVMAILRNKSSWKHVFKKI